MHNLKKTSPDQGVLNSISNIFFHLVYASLLLSTVAFALASITVVHAQPVNVAVIASSNDSTTRVELFKNEIRSLLEGDIRVEFTRHSSPAESTVTQVQALFERVVNASKTDLVLVMDEAANQSLGLLSEYPKPTVLPLVINAQLAGFPLTGESSGKANLHYLSVDFDFGKVLQSYQSIAPFTRAVIAADPSVERNLGSSVISQAKVQAKQAGVELQVQPFGGDADLFIQQLPADTEVVLYGFLPSANTKQIQSLIDAVNSEGILSYALTGEELVRKGAFATQTAETDWAKLARRTALHIQEILMGAPAAELPVLFESSDRLMINMATSRQIRIAPGFDIQSDAILLNAETDDPALRYSLSKVAELALHANLELFLRRIQSEIAQSVEKEVSASLLPQVGASVDYLVRRDETEIVKSGGLAESAFSGSISVTQLLYSESLRADIDIQKYLVLSEQELVREVELDITQAAVNAYLNVLRQKTALEQAYLDLDLTRENYRLAENRVGVGVQTAADLYRWESELANAKQTVLRAKSSFKQQKQKLNQLLNRPIDEDFSTTAENLQNPTLMISDSRVINLIRNTYDLEVLTAHFVAIGLERAPELKQIQAVMGANRRQLKSDRNAYWSPDVSLFAEYTETFDEERTAGGPSAEGNDWNVGVQLSIPLFEGGARSERIAQSRLAVQESEISHRDMSNRIEQQIRSNVASTHASYHSIPLAERSKEAAKNNFDLINESYAEGSKGITDVLDAQDALITAREASLSAVYRFLIDLMDLQRSIGAYDFFLSDEQRSDLIDELIRLVQQSRRQPNH
ncbi:MAG: TolC family protein [Pseudomonadota bacterium]